jgi:hypothetical protein
MTAPIVAAIGAAIVISGGALISWGILLAVGRLAPRSAAAISAVAWLLVIAAPTAGFIADRLRAPVTCGPGEECYDYIFWWLAIPVGLTLATAVLIAGIAWGRTHTPNPT